MAKIKPKSREEIWKDAISLIEVALYQLKDVSPYDSEYQDWKDNNVEDKLEEFEGALDDLIELEGLMKQ
jgi:hypothetical protein